MLLLDARQAMAVWEAVELAIVRSAPPTAWLTETRSLALKQAVISGLMQVWFLVEAGVSVEPVACVVTRLSDDDCDGTRLLMIYAFYSFKPIQGVGLWGMVCERLFDFARQNRCDKVWTFTDLPSVIEYASKHWNADTSMRLLTVNLHSNESEG
jgi:hypothetical protein